MFMWGRISESFSTTILYCTSYIEELMLLESEIAQQPTVMQRLLTENMSRTKTIIKAIQAFDPAYVCIAARGTSDNAARYAQYLFGSVLELPVMLASPSLHTIYGTPPNLSKALVIGISQSGKAEDVRTVLQDANEQGALTLAITNFDDSPMAQTAQHHLPLLAEEELSVAATKTYTAQLTIVAMLGTLLANDDTMLTNLTTLPSLTEETLKLTETISTWSDRYRYMDKFIVLGRGFNYSTAFEISLKVKELTYISSEGYSEADFRHGPIAVVNNGFPIMLVAPQGKIFPQMTDMMKKLQESNAETLLISNDADLLSQATKQLPIPAVPEWLSPIISVIPGQVFAMNQAIARGLEVDKPRGLSKVTITQ
jgi:glutamine---fructose-6-phosphate transaminase (isomerizing)